CSKHLKSRPFSRRILRYWSQRKQGWVLFEYSRFDRPKLRFAKPLFLAHDVSNPCQVGDALLVRRKDAIALAVIVFAFPVHGRFREARLQQQFTDFRRRPQAPLVGERLLDLRAIRKLEVDVAARDMGYRMELRLVPDIGKFLVLGLLA